MKAASFIFLLLLPLCIFCATSKTEKPSWYNEEDVALEADEQMDYSDAFSEDSDTYEYEPHDGKPYTHQERQQNNIEKRNPPDVSEGLFLQYDYEVQILNGVSDETMKQVSGTIMRAKVNLLRSSGHQCLVQFGDVKFGKLNKPIDNPRSSLNSDQFELVTVDQKLIAVLQLPIKLNCNKQQANFIIRDGDDQPWSTNIKRGALDLLLPGFRQIFQDHSRSVSSLSLEESVEGKCVVEYHVEKNKNIKNNVYNVTKTIDHDTCIRKPLIKRNFRSLTRCSAKKDASDQDELVKKSGSTKFLIAMTQNAPKVVSAKANNQYSLALSSDKANQLLTFVNQKIKLIGETPGKTVDEPKNPAKDRAGRVYSIEWDSAYEKALMFGRRDHLKRASVYNTFSSITNILKQAFADLLKNAQRKTSKSLNQIEALIETVTFLRLASPNDLKNFEKSLGLNVDQERQTPNHDDQGQITAIDQYAQVLGICGSNTCVKRLVQLIHMQRISQMKVILALNEIRNAPVISIEIIKELVTLARSIEQLNSENQHFYFPSYFLKQTIWLLSGTLVHDLCPSSNIDKLAIRQEQDGQAICTAQFKQDFVRLIISSFEKSNDWQDQIIFTKTLGNAGLLESMEDLKHLIHNKQKNLQIFSRSSAIYALKKMAVVKPQYVESILKPIIENDKEEQELRIASIHVLLSANPDKAFVDYLAGIQKKEYKSSPQVASYITSILGKIGASSSHCATTEKSHFNEALRSVKCQAQNQSFTGSFSFNCPAVGAGVDAEFQLSYCNGAAETCGWPFHQVFDLSADWLGLQQKSLFTLGAVALDGEKLMHKTGQAFWRASKQNPQSMDDFWSHDLGSMMPKNERITDVINSIINYIRGIKKQDQTSNPELPPKAVIYLKFKDQNIGFLPISDKLISQALPHLLPQLEYLENDLKNWLSFDLNRVSMMNDIQYKTATSAGIPIYVSFKQPVIFNFKGKVRSDKVRSSPLAFDSQLDSSMTARMSTIIDMHTWIPTVISGNKYENRLNIDLLLKGQLNGDMKNKKQFVKITLPKVEDGSNTLELESQTTSYTTLWSEYISTLSGKKEKILISKNQITAKHCIEEPITGSTICAKTVNQPEFAQFDIFRPKKLTIQAEADQVQNYPVEIEIMTEHQINRSPSKVYESDNPVIMNNVKIRSKSDARQSSLNFVYVKDPSKAFSKIKVIFAKQWKSDTGEPLLVCFDAEKQTLPENYDKSRKNLFQSSLNWGASTCHSDRNVAVKILHTEFPTEKSTPKKCTKDSCDFDNTDKFWNTFIVDINYNKVPVSIKNMTNKLYRSWKHAFYAKTDVAQIGVMNPAGKIWSKIAIPSDKCVQEADITLKIPGENVTFHKITVPSWIFKPFKNEIETKNIQPSASKHTAEDSERLFDDTEDSEEPESVWSWLQHKSHKQPANDEYRNNRQGNIKLDDDILRYDDPSEGLDEGFELWPGKEERPEKPLKSDVKQKDWNHDWEQHEDVMKSFNSKNNEQSQSGAFSRNKFEKEAVQSDDKYTLKTTKVCHVSPNSVETFETVSYKFDMPQCYTIISKDCSRRGMFIIMTKKDESTQKFSELFILTNKHKVLLKIEATNGKEHKFRLLIDDVEQTLKNNVETLARGSRDIRLMKHGNHVDVHLIDMQIDIEFEPRSVVLKMAERSTPHQCGLCGQSQNQDSSYKEWPNTSSDKVLRKYIIDKYVVKSKDCKVDQTKYHQTQSPYEKSSRVGKEFDPNLDVSAVHHGNHPYFDRDNDHGSHNLYHGYDGNAEENQYNEYVSNVRKGGFDEDEY